MKLLFLLIFFLCCSGCVSKHEHFGYPNHSFAPSLGYTQAPIGQWNIIAPPQGIWERRPVKAYLPTYFSKEALWSISHDPINFFYATYMSEDGTEIALWVRFLDAFYDTHRIDYVIGGPNAWDSIVFKDNRDSCVQFSEQLITIGFNATNVIFETSAVYFLKNNKKIKGVEIRGSGMGRKEQQMYPNTSYNLADPKTIQERQPYSGARTPFNFATFYFKFPLTCADLEGAEFVIDGLSRQGKLLPPLRVRLNYFDFSKVPK